MPLTPNEAAVHLGLHLPTVRQKLRDGVPEGRLREGPRDVDEQGLLPEDTRARWNDTDDDRTPDINASQPPAEDGTPAKGGHLLRDDAPPEEPREAWLLLAVGEDRAFGSNDGYDDEPESRYTWDNTVPNHGRIKVGDFVVLWDKKSSIGASVVSSIRKSITSKSIHRCPNLGCGKAHIKARKNKRPTYRCFTCGKNFDKPNTSQLQVVEYTAGYKEAWVDLSGLLDADRLRSLCVKPKSQLSMRPLIWDRLRAEVARAGGPELLTVLEAPTRTLLGGHRPANVRARVGQGAFRRHLLATTGAVCAFTGPAPAAALEAAHLYSYAETGEHHEYGGLLMRRDLHRLFDLGFIAVDPATLTIDVAPTLADYPAYIALQGAPLTCRLTRRQASWITDHWAEHRLGAR